MAFAPNAVGVMALMKGRFMDMEHYWVGLPMGEKPHTGFIYCGFVDNLESPVVGRVFRSVSYEGLIRLLYGDDPDFVPKISSNSKKRFKWKGSDDETPF